jgi:hypothetical protein
VLVLDGAKLTDRSEQLKRPIQLGQLNGHPRRQVR